MLRTVMKTLSNYTLLRWKAFPLNGIDSKIKLARRCNKYPSSSVNLFHPFYQSTSDSLEQLKQIIYPFQWGSGGGGGTGRSKPPTSRTLQSQLPPLFSWLPPFCPFSISKYYAMLRNFPLFLPPPALSSPASCTPPTAYFPGSRPPVPPPPHIPFPVE